MKRLVIYDLDGTLVDTRDDIAQSANHMLEMLGAAPLPREEICRHVGNGVRQLIRGCLNTQDPDRIEEGVKVYRAHYAKHLLDHTALYPFAREVLDHFKERKQAVFTNKPNPFSRDILVDLGVADYFCEIVAGDSPFAKKPDPEAILTLMKREGIFVTQVLLVGDSPLDVQTGKAAGVATVGTTHGFSEEEELKASCPDFLVHDFEQLLLLAREKRW